MLILLSGRPDVVDVVAALYGQDDYTKANNYWRWLKRRLIKEQNQLVSVTHGFKFVAVDGKRRLADTLDSEGVISLAKHFPNNNAIKFLDWFTYSDNSIDGQSKKKAYSFFESNLISDAEIGTTKSLQQIYMDSGSVNGSGFHSRLRCRRGNLFNIDWVKSVS